MSLLAEIADRLHFSLACKRAARQVQRRLAATLPAPTLPPQLERLQLVGKVVEPQWVVAPLTGAQVVGYRILIETVGRYWMNRQVLVDHCVVGDFFLRGEGGKHFVKGSNARLIAEESCFSGRRTGGSVDQPKAFPEQVVAVLADRAQFRAEVQDGRHYRWHEYHLHEGDEVFVDGSSGYEMLEEGGEGTPCAMGASDRPLLLSRIPRDELLRNLSAPDEAVMRALPRMISLSDRDA